MLWGLIHSPKPPEITQVEYKIWGGWGGRIRTSDWLIQNQPTYLKRLRHARSELRT